MPNTSQKPASQKSEKTAGKTAEKVSTPFVWELTAPAAFPVFIDGHEDPAFIEFEPYGPRELKDILRSITTGFRQHRRNMEAMPGDTKPYARLFDEHFVRIVNGTGKPAEQREFLSGRGAYGKADIIAKSVGGFELAEEKQRVASGKFDIFAKPSRSVTLEQDLYDADSDSVLIVSMVHEYSAPTEEQYRKYRAARRSQHVSRKKMWALKEDYDALEAAYDDVIQSVSGVAVNGEACTEETRDEWVAAVPLWHKLLVVDSIYEALAEKNE